ncbi:TetR family transcriptional regulator [Rhizobium sp. LC145]|uniref:TetR family transcriptional regulator n=1 Tax=Rhizobium sp. LC145 TaxID=1120688 RepID=UPI00062A4FC7|nr:TetR family transcriptional regulator [Rhizobium sp. LC145]KKX34062.1 TetR family transcriptional regulator [Rhizobium sp. LC145]TKT66968.1 TetR family transcriptional regulator [Rhizobiaceae bacterium LC148]
MTEKKPREAAEGRRERKRRQTRERIQQAAMTLFLERGFEETTVEDIAEAADVSKRSFFDYFPSKEDVVFAWQDTFAQHLMNAIAKRPPEEPAVSVVRHALLDTVVAAADQRALAIGDLINRTPALKARDQLKYAKLEQKLAEALEARARSKEERDRMRLLAAVVIGMLRIGAERWKDEPKGASFEAFSHTLFNDLWKMLADLGGEARG